MSNPPRRCRCRRCAATDIDNGKCPARRSGEPGTSLTGVGQLLVQVGESEVALWIDPLEEVLGA